MKLLRQARSKSARGLDKKHRPAPIIRKKQPNHHGPRFSRRADGAHYCHRYIWLRRFGWSLTLVGHAVSGASVEPPVVAPRAAGAISQQFDRTQQDPRRKALHKSGAGIFTFAARKANDAPRGRSAASNNSKTAADRLRHNALLPHWGAAWSLPIPIISPVHVAAANSNLKTRAKIPQPDHPCTFSSAKTAGTFIQLSNELVKTLADQLVRRSSQIKWA